uniref:Uncharacterized protein n=1 Tax=Picea sitchensis TaxID=3332 RepID=A9NSL1_PICSI|nr:unknown [Picea sitchensis]
MCRGYSLQPNEAFRHDRAWKEMWDIGFRRRGAHGCQDCQSLWASRDSHKLV